MTQRRTFNACPSCNRLMTWQTDKQKCPNCGHEEPLSYIRERPEVNDDPILDALQTLQAAVRGISGTWTESIDNAMQQADAAIDHHARSRMALGLADVEGETRTVAELLANADALAELLIADLTEANKTASGLASLLLIALIEQSACIKSRIRAILSAVQREGKPDAQTT